MSNHIADDGDLQAPLPEIPERPIIAPVDLNNPPPKEMRDRHQWACWKMELIDGKWKKPPYHPRTGRKVSATSLGQLCTYDQAIRAYQSGEYDGICYHLRATDNLVAIDIDSCRDPQSGVIEQWAWRILQVLQTRAENSPRGGGIHAFVHGKIGRNRSRDLFNGRIEFYSEKQFITWTGQLLTEMPSDIAYRLRDEEPLWSVAHLYEALFLEDILREQHRRTLGGGEIDLSWPEPVPLTADQRAALRRSDARLIQRMREAKNGERFQELFDDGCEDDRGGLHVGDLQLCLILLFWTQDDILAADRLFRQSARMRPKWDRKVGPYSYGQVTLWKAVNRRYGLSRIAQPASAPISTPAPDPVDPEPESAAPPVSAPAPAPRPKREVRFIEHELPETLGNHPGQGEEETAESLAANLNAIGRQLKCDVRALLDNGLKGVVALLAPPGTGKSHQVAELGEHTTVHSGGEYDIAWIAERHAMVESVRALRHYHQIDPCSASNCEDYELHQSLAARGYNTFSVHGQHNSPCTYMRQFRLKGSAVLQLPHVRTKYPADHGVIVIDELDLPKWLPETPYTRNVIDDALTHEEPESAVAQFGNAIREALRLCDHNSTKAHGRELMNAVNQAAGQHLYDLVVQLRNNPKYNNERPVVDINLYDEESRAHAANLPPVILPHLINAFDRELLKWDQGNGPEWNSYLRIGPSVNGYALWVTNPLRFGKGEKELPPRIILDATADEELLQLLLKDEQVQIQRAEVKTPDTLLHVAVRTGKRYGKRALCTKRRGNGTNRKKEENKDLKRAIAECRFLLARYDPDGSKAAAGKIGIISFMTCVDEIAQALNIPATVEVVDEHGETATRKRRGYYWNMRGSNEMEDCEILICLGTPTLRPDEVIRLARALWHDDPEPINPASNKDEETGKYIYEDPRLERLNAYLTRAELTQCAHRSRALRHPGRIIITLCKSEIDFLPIRHEYVELPRLSDDGRIGWLVSREEETAKLDAAMVRLTEAGIKATVRSLRAEACVSREAAQRYLHPQSIPPTPPSVLYTEHDDSVPESAINVNYSDSGYTDAPEVPAPPARTLAPEDRFMPYGRSHNFPALDVAGFHLPAGSSSWSRFHVMAGPWSEHRPAVYALVAELWDNEARSAEGDPPTG
ncbi:MAG TPA: hypothetical protein VFV38_08805 [Ktedonobacteraceae bacterium]|nr:hypothetical protein [Ktedonobacteraceae bacterium]